jgi:hypothetical protein
MPNDIVRASAPALPKSRRAALGLFASASALAVTPVAAIAAGLEVDPIFAAIKRHNAAWKAFGDTCPRTDNVVAESEGREVTEADEAAWSTANEAEEDAFEALITLPPVTLAGLRSCGTMRDADAGWKVSSLTAAGSRRRLFSFQACAGAALSSLRTRPRVCRL